MPLPKTMSVFVLVKPDGVRRRLGVSIQQRFNRRGFVLRRSLRFDGPVPLRKLFAEHYIEHAEKPFYTDLVTEMSAGPVVAWHLELVRRSSAADSCEAEDVGSPAPERENSTPEDAASSQSETKLEGMPAGGWEEEAVRLAREVCAEIRREHAMGIRHNTVHVSDSPKAAARELKLWFGTG